MTIESLLSWVQSQEAQIFDREIEDLFCFHLKLSWSELHLKKKEKLPSQVEKKIRSDFMKMMKGHPLAYVIGEKFFYKSSFQVSPAVLIPRPETEILVEEALLWVQDKNSKIMDLGTGSGCIGLSIAKEKTEDSIVLVEASGDALAVAKANIQRLQLKNVRAIEYAVGSKAICKDLQKGSFDLIVSNPPYIENGDTRVEKRVHDFEPHQALYASEKGGFWIHKFLLWGYDYLKEGGGFIFEFGKGQEDTAQSFAKEVGYEFLGLMNDYSGTPRFLKLRK